MSCCIHKATISANGRSGVLRAFSLTGTILESHKEGFELNCSTVETSTHSQKIELPSAIICTVLAPTTAAAKTWSITWPYRTLPDASAATQVGWTMEPSSMPGRPPAAAGAATAATGAATAPGPAAAAATKPRRPRSAVASAVASTRKLAFSAGVQAGKPYTSARTTPGGSLPGAGRNRKDLRSWFWTDIVSA